METFTESNAVTSNIDEELRRILGLRFYEVSDVSVSEHPKREAYFELQIARTMAQKEGIVPPNNQSLRDAATVLAFVVSETIRTPAVFPLSSGGIGLQWNGKPNTIFTASLYGDGLVTYSQILSDSDGLTGTCNVSGLKKSFRVLIEEALEQDN